MSNNIGTLIIAPIRPQSVDDEFPVAIAEEIQGGYHSVLSIADRNVITYDRLKLNMLCGVADDGSGNFSLYRLINVPSQVNYGIQGGTVNNDWRLLNEGGSGRFVMLFNDMDTIDVNHALDNMYPFIMIIDSFNDREIVCDIHYIDEDNLIVNINKVMSGIIICN